LFSFVLHKSEKDTHGHYIAYVKQYEVWNEYNDDKVTLSVDVCILKNSAYYYCYRKVTGDYAAYVHQTTLVDIVDKQCVYCGEVVHGPSTYYIPGKLDVAGAMVDHLKLCDVIVSSRERIRHALEKHNKERSMLDIPSHDIRSFFTQASKALNASHAQVCINAKLVNKSSKKNCTKILRAKAQNLPTHQ
jgi:hypothetical protein